MKSKDHRREVAYLLCLGLAAVIAIWSVVKALPPKNDRYSSVHPAAEMPELWGFSQDSLVNIGDAKQLDTLPGVGEVIAQRIIDAREAMGGFRLPEDLMLVKGIGEKTFAKIMDALAEPLVLLPEMQN